MDPFAAHQPDEGYSEAPLNPGPPQSSIAIKPRDDPASPLLGLRSTAEVPSFLMRHIASMSLPMKTRQSLPSLHVPGSSRWGVDSSWPPQF